MNKVCIFQIYLGLQQIAFMIFILMRFGGQQKGW